MKPSTDNTNLIGNHKPWYIIASIVTLLASFSLYYGIGLYNLHLPGLQYDEAADAVPAIELIMGQHPSSISTISLFGRDLPLMMLHHIGPTTIYTSYIGMSLMGISVETLRLTQLVVGALTLLLLWFMAYRWFGAAPAAVASLICATAPAFIWWNRAGANWTAPLLPIALGMLWLLWQWWRFRQPWLLIGAAFLFGFGVMTKILFIWLVVPVGLTAICLLGLRGILPTLRAIRTSTILLTLLALVIGLGPLLVHNVIYPGATLKFIADNALTTRIYGHNNLDVIANLGIVIPEFVRMMGGDTLAFDAPAGLPLGGIALVCSLIYLIMLCWRYRSAIRVPLSPSNPTPLQPSVHAPRHLRLYLFLSLCIVTVIPLSTVSTSSAGAIYLFVLVPLAWLLVAVALCDAMLRLGKRMATQQYGLAAVVVTLVLAFNQIGTNIAILRFFDATGGHDLWSDAIYTLADSALTRYADRPLIAMDWGFARNITFLTAGRVHMREMYEFLPEPSQQFESTCIVLLRDPLNVYVFHAPALAAFKGFWEVFDRTVQKQHKQITLEQAIPTRDGYPNTLIYTAQELQRSFTISPTLATRNATFDGQIKLLGGTATYRPDQHEVAVVLYWQSLADHLPDDVVLVHVVNQSTGEAIAIGDQEPDYGSYPFSQWQRGEVVSDPHWITIPATVSPGIYQVRIGIYDRTTGIRRTIDDPLHDAAGDSLMLHFFQID